MVGQQALHFFDVRQLAVQVDAQFGARNSTQQLCVPVTRGTRACLFTTASLFRNNVVALTITGTVVHAGPRAGSVADAAPPP